MAWFVSRRNCPSFLTANTVAGPLGSAHRSGTTSGNHQDPPAALLLHRRTAHPLGAPPHPASSPTLALGNPVHSRLGPIASHSLSSLTAPSVPDAPTGQPKGCPPESCQSSPQVPLLACRLAVFACRCHIATGVATAHYLQPHLSGPGLARSPSRTHHPPCQRQRRIPSVDSGLNETEKQSESKHPERNRLRPKPQTKQATKCGYNANQK